jgi:hypothetical protein
MEVKMEKLLILLLSCFGLFACTASFVPNYELNWKDQNAIASKIVIKNDDFKKITDITGPSCWAQNCKKKADLSSEGQYGGSVHIRSWVKSGLKTYQLYGTLYGKDWMFIDHAFDSDGKKYDLVQISRDTLTCKTSCTVQEHVGVTLSESAMSLYSKEGFKIVFYGKQGQSGAWVIPPEYFKAMLEATNKA